MSWFWLVSAGIAVWVFLDAKRRIVSSPLLWAIGTFLLLVVVLPLYLAKRPLLGDELREGGTAWNVLRYFAVAWTVMMLFIGLGYVASVGNLASTTTSGAEQAGFAIGATLGLGALAALWFFPMVGALVLGFFLKNSAIVERGVSQRSQEDAIIAQAKRMKQEEERQRELEEAKRTLGLKHETEVKSRPSEPVEPFRMRKGPS